eukprot:TRINITY_DN1942_c0_g1_i3.p1 TRINITY_DN1942_c0_g1~~TRINITY_DN1942_c0_g1_i3.p1  ORF type:complete len:465 (-),score=78.90 TRINITY_DN1942_c0_g1_i3:148-1542(-)
MAPTSEEQEGLLSTAPNERPSMMTVGIGSVASIALVCSLVACFKPLGLQDKRVNLGKVYVDIDKQNGLTADLGVGVKITNDMSDSLHDNDGAYSAMGSVERINGAFDNNAISRGGDVVRANGAMDNNALAGNGDVTRTNGALLAKRGHQFTSDSINNQVSKSLSSLIGAYTYEDGSSGGEFGSGQTSFNSGTPPWDSQSNKKNKSNELEKWVANVIAQQEERNQSSKQNKSNEFEQMVAKVIGFEEAEQEERNQEIIAILNKLYGPFPNNTTAAGLDESVSESQVMQQMQQNMMNQEIRAMQQQANAVNLVVSTFFNNTNKTAWQNLSYDGQYGPQIKRKNETEHYMKLSGQQISALVTDLSKKVQRPVDIERVNIRVRKQNGLQANVDAGFSVNNSMAGTMHHNNIARSKYGNVWRFNGVYDNNAISRNGSVLRANGAYDNNARTNDGSVLRNNGAMEDLQPR